MNAQAAAATRDGLLAKLENEHKAMLAVLEHVPDDKLDYTPDPRLKPFGEMAFHIYGAGMWFGDIVTHGSMDFPQGEPPAAPETKQALAGALEQMNGVIRKKFADASPDALAKVVEFGKFGSYPAVTFVDWHVSHLIHHRAQLALYLRMMGAKVPAIYGGSLDYPLEM